MARLWMSNVPPEAGDDEIAALAKKFAPQLECLIVQREPGDGTRPVAFLTFKGGSLGDVERLADRLNGMFWRGRTLGCSTIV
jgi:hypothetical protein